LKTEKKIREPALPIPQAEYIDNMDAVELAGVVLEADRAELNLVLVQQKAFIGDRVEPFQALIGILFYEYKRVQTRFSKISVIELILIIT
jgi:hypothetical protein